MTKDYLISPNKFWDLFFQKFFSQLISIKVWVMLGAAFLCIFGFLTGGELVTIWLAVLAIKSAYEIVDVFKAAKAKEGIEAAPDDEILVEEKSVQRMLKGV